ncbi:MAG: TonB-dependent receptor plug domain-containing protein [Bacteroidetes bacterium]|nr:TonB-dependent receptor plug domain-containing protein [Bacteroidota bacterium]
MLKLKHLLSILLLMSGVVASAQSTGKIEGIVVDSVSQETLIGATVVIKNVTPLIGTTTDIDGNFSIDKLKPGKYTLEISYVSYQKLVVTDVIVKAGKSTNLRIQMNEALHGLQEYVVVAQHVTNDVTVVKEIQESDNVVSGISNEQITKSQDRTAAEVVRRISGVTIMDGRFILIRGLNDRYNSVWLNGATAPSSETDRKSFSFDILPSSLIDRVMIYKTPSPELPGDFAGGLVKIYTRNNLPSGKLNVTLGAGYRPGSSFQTTTGEFGKTDWLGFDDGHRALPNIPHIYSSLSDQSKNQLADQFRNNWALTNRNTLMDKRLAVSYADHFTLFNKRVSSITAINYSNLNTIYNITRKVFDVKGQKADSLSDKQFTNQIRAGIIQNFQIDLNIRNKITFTNLLNQNGSNQFTLRKTYDNNGVARENNYSIAYQQRSVYNSQLAGAHTTKDEKTKIDWLVGYSHSRKNTPDLRRAAYSVNKTKDDSTYYSIMTPAPGQVDIIRAGRLYQDLNENTFTANFNIDREVHVSKYVFHVKAGTYQEYKSRSFLARAFGYSPYSLAAYNQKLQYLPLDKVFSSEYVGNSKGFQMLEDINTTYKYNATNMLNAYYLMGRLPIGKKIKIVGGVRYEHNNQGISTMLNSTNIDTNVVTNFILPSINASYNFTDKTVLRLAYGKSLNRPEFREWAPFYYYNFDFNVLNYGSMYLNPSNPLKVATIQNFDCRIENYSSNGEMLSFGLFYKKFTNPIESVVIPTTNLAYSFANAPGAYSYGLEVDVRKNLSFLDTMLGSKVFSNLSVIANATLIKSKVLLGNNIVTWNPTRALQGQSPYAFNVGMFYKSDSAGLSLSVLYNIVGPRIAYVGSDQYPDVIEMPRGILDVNLTKCNTPQY